MAIWWLTVVSALDVSFSFSLSTSLFLLPSLGVVTHSLLELGAEATQGRETVLDLKRFRILAEEFGQLGPQPGQALNTFFHS